MDDLDRARARYPVGARVAARVVQLQVFGIFLEADDPPTGFVDVTCLPRDPAKWPAVGDVAEFEVLQHRNEQMRLWPIDPAWRGHTYRLENDDEWSAIRHRLHVDDLVSGQVTHVFTANRECVLNLGFTTAVAEWTGDAPTVGQERHVLVKAVLDTTRRVLVELA